MASLRLKVILANGSTVPGQELLVDTFDPAHCVRRIAPRQLLVIAVRDDWRFPPRGVRSARVVDSVMAYRKEADRQRLRATGVSFTVSTGAALSIVRRPNTSVGEASPGSRRRARGGRAFPVVKRLWGFPKVRYRGILKNTVRAFATFALTQPLHDSVARRAASRHVSLLSPDWADHRPSSKPGARG